MTAELAANLLLYGNSLLLAGVKAQLKSCDGVTLQHVSPNSAFPAWQGLLAAGDTHALLFDMTATAPDFMFPLLRERPNLMLIGLDPSSDEALVVTCRSVPAVSVGDLASVIRRATEHSHQPAGRA